MSDDTSTLGGRIGQAIDGSQFNQSSLARELGTTSQVVNKWVNQGVMPEGKHLVRLPELLDVSGHWLLTGEGSPRREEPSDDQAAALDLLRRSLAHLASDPIPEMMKRARRIVDDGDEGLPDQ